MTTIGTVKTAYLRVETQDGNFKSVAIKGGYNFTDGDREDLGPNIKSVRIEYRDVPDCKTCIANGGGHDCYRDCPAESY